MGLGKNLAVALLSSALLTGAAQAEEAKVITLKEVEKAETVDQLLGLGAVQVKKGEFTQIIVGRELSDAGKGWTWVIAPDGTTSSAAKDGSWKEENAPWSMKGNQYCTENEGCRSVFKIGDYMRMSDKADEQRLSPWTVKIGN
jgi:hypothetical protein